LGKVPSQSPSSHTNSSAIPRVVEFRRPDGLTLRGDAWGEENNPPVLLLHGGGQTRNAWGETSRVLAENGYFALALDLRGHGESDWSKDGEYGILQFLTDTKAVIDSLNAPPVLVGASIGGIITLLLQGESPVRICKGIVLVDVAPRIRQEGINRIRAFMEAHLDGFASLEEAATAVARYLPHRSRPDDFTGIEKNLRKGEDGRFHWHWDPAMLLNFKVKEVRNEGRLMAAAHSLKVPLLFVRGTLSDIVSTEIMQEFLKAVPHAQSVEIPGAGHTVPGDSNELFTEAVLNFIRGLEN
jgi:pimeloyl-ACP methyl ester carboxylesterase